jgi:hypothetical protein
VSPPGVVATAALRLHEALYICIYEGGWGLFVLTILTHAFDFSRQDEPVGPPPSYDAFAALLDPQTAAGSSGAAVAPAASPAASPAGPALEQTGGGQRETAAERKATKRQRNIARAKALLSKKAFVEAKIWKANRAGLLVDADHVTGFVRVELDRRAP